MAESPPAREDDGADRAASLLAQGLRDVLRSLSDRTAIGEVRGEVIAARGAIDALAGRMDRQLAEDRDQRQQLGLQLTALAGSLDRLVTHLQALSTLMAELLERLASPQEGPPRVPTQAPEPAFMPGGEGVTLVISGVPGFQSLMDIQKALAALPAVESASVERYQQGDSRILVRLGAPATPGELVAAVGGATGLNAALEEARPETLWLKVKLLNGA